MTIIDLEDKSLRCRIEGCGAILDYIPHDGCFRCSLCGAEVWGDECRKGRITTAEAREVYRLHQRTTDLLRKHGGGSRMAGRKRKDVKKLQIEGVQPNWRGYDEV